MEPELIRAVARLSERYEREYLARWVSRKAEYGRDWLSALQFFFEHVFYQGRRDSLSERYCQLTVSVLQSYFSNEAAIRRSRFDEAWRLGWIPHEPLAERGAVPSSPLVDRLVAASAGKQRDREMVLDTLRYVRSLLNWNVVAHSLDQVRRGDIVVHYDELHDIRQIGHKTASFYLRDLCTIYDLEQGFQDLVATQPIDTWVRTLSERLHIISGNETDLAVRRRILNAYLSAGVSPAKYNAGAWYLGTHSLTLALEGLQSPATT